MPNTVLTILLVEDNPDDAYLICDHLAEAVPPICRVHQAATLREAVQLLQTTQFDVVLLDLSLPDAHGIETVQRIQSAAAALPVVVLTGLKDEAVALQAVSAGAQDYLIKGQVDGLGLARAIRYAIERKQAQQALYQVNALLTERVAELERRHTELPLLNDMGDGLQVSHAVAEVGHVPLSAREKEVLALLVQGQAAREIAETLYISYATVRNHLYTILRKHGVHSQRQAVKLALERRLV